MLSSIALIIGVALVFVTWITNRVFGRWNLKTLTPEERSLLFEHVLHRRSWPGTLIIVLIVAASVPLWTFPRQPLAVIFFCVVALAAIAIGAVLRFFAFRKIAALGLPPDYVSRLRMQAVLAQTMQFLSLGCFAVRHLGFEFRSVGSGRIVVGQSGMSLNSAKRRRTAEAD